MPEGVGAPTLEAPVAPPGGGGIGGGLEGGGLGALAGKTEAFGTPPSMPEIGEFGIGEVPDAASLAQIAEAKLGTPEVGIQEVAGIGIPEAGQEVKPPPGIKETATKPPLETAPPPQAPPLGPEASVPPPAQGEEKPATTETIPPPPEAGKAEAPPSPTVEEKGEPPVESAAKLPEEAALQDKKDTKPPEDPAKAKRTQELEEKVKNRTATADEMRELRDLKKDPEQRRKDLEQKALDGTITDDEIQELEKLNVSEDLKNLTPEQQMEKLQKDIDDLGTELMKKMANGEEVTPQDLEKLRNLRSQEQLIKQGFTPDQARSLGRIAERMRSKWTERQTQAAKEIQAEIQELMALELYLLSIPKNVETLRSQAKKLKGDAQAAHQDAEATHGPDRVQKKQKEYTLYLQLLNVKSAIVAQKHMVPRIEARRQDLEQAVRRKLGVSHGLAALVEWGAAKTRYIATGIGTGIEEEADFRLETTFRRA